MSYWFAAVLLVVFGFATGFSIGGPILVVGLAMLVLGPVRRQPRLFWPPFLGVLAFIVGVIAFIPLSCIAAAGVSQVSTTVCTGILGPTWSGVGPYNPPPEAFALALRAGAVAAVATALVAVAWQSRRRRPTSPGGGKAPVDEAPQTPRVVGE